MATRTCTPWADSGDAIAPCNDYTVDPAELDMAMSVASNVLYNFTNRKYRGICTDFIRPTARWRTYDGPPAWWPIVGGNLRPARYGYCSCNRSPDFGCARMPMIRLPGYPVIRSSIVVTIDGVLFTGWELEAKRRLVRTDGEGWRCCQNRHVADGEVGTWSIEYSYGVNPPADLKRAAVILGCQLYNAWHPGEGRTCQLPQRVTTISRQGVTLAILDPLKLFDEGKTGIPSVDMIVAADRKGDTTKTTLIIPGRSARQYRTR